MLNSIVGIAGLEPTLRAIEAGSTLALANKESLVAGGRLVTDAAESRGVSILPVDSEHSAIFQSMQGCRDKRQIKRLILTASGGRSSAGAVRSLRRSPRSRRFATLIGAWAQK